MTPELAVSGGRLSIPITAVLAPLGVWLLMAVMAVLNGGFRELFLIPRIGSYPGHVLSTGLLVGVILLITWVFFDRIAFDYALSHLVLMGAAWVVMTVGFEFLVGYLEGTPVSVTLGQYDVLAGQVWIAVPLVLFLAPLLFGR